MTNFFSTFSNSTKQGELCVITVARIVSESFGWLSLIKLFDTSIDHNLRTGNETVLLGTLCARERADHRSRVEVPAPNNTVVDAVVGRLLAGVSSMVLPICKVLNWLERKRLDTSF